MPGPRALSEQQLEQLSADSRDPALAQQLVEAQVPQQLVLLLAQHVADVAAAERGAALPAAQRQSFLLALRTVRNLCAAGDAAIKQLARADAAAQLTAIACTLLASQPREGPILKASLQALANFVTGSLASASQVWQAMFPAALQAIATGYPDLHELGGCLAWRCGSASSDAHCDLMSPDGTRLLQALLTHAPEGQSRLWLQQLLVEACIVEGRLAHVLDGLPLEAHTLVLHLLSEELGSRDTLALRSPPAAQLLAATLMDLLPAAAAGVAGAAATGDAAAAEAAAHSLEALVKVVRDLSGIDPRDGLGAEVDALWAMCQRGLAGLLLAMLRALPPITKRGVAPPGGAAAAELNLAAGEPAAAAAGELAAAAAQYGAVPPAPAPSMLYPSFVPYHGYRSDLVAVLGNAAFGRPPVQEQISVAGGVELLLEQCQIDDDSPLVKEWALWGVRNLSAHAGVKATIEALQAQGVASSDVLKEAGYEATLNAATKRPRLVRVDPTG